jgi:hypothetical protein
MTTIKWRTAFCETWGLQRHRGKGLPVMDKGESMKEKRKKKGRKKEFGWEDRQKWEAEGRKEKKEEGRNWYDKAVGKVWIGEPRRKRKGGKEKGKKK